MYLWMNFDEFSVLKSRSHSSICILIVNVLSRFSWNPCLFLSLWVCDGRGDECVLRGCSSIQFETNKPFSFFLALLHAHALTICRKVVCSFVDSFSPFICSLGSFDTLRFCCYSLAHSLWCLLDLDLHRKYIIYITNINHLLHIKHLWLNSHALCTLFERERNRSLYTISSYTLEW